MEFYYIPSCGPYGARISLPALVVFDTELERTLNKLSAWQKYDKKIMFCDIEHLSWEFMDRGELRQALMVLEQRGWTLKNWNSVIQHSDKLLQ